MHESVAPPADLLGRRSTGGPLACTAAHENIRTGRMQVTGHRRMPNSLAGTWRRTPGRDDRRVLHLLAQRSRSLLASSVSAPLHIVGVDRVEEVRNASDFHELLQREAAPANDAAPLIGARRRPAELLAVGAGRDAGPLAERVAERGLRRIARQVRGLRERCSLAQQYRRLSACGDGSGSRAVARRRVA